MFYRSIGSENKTIINLLHRIHSLIISFIFAYSKILVKNNLLSSNINKLFFNIYIVETLETITVCIAIVIFGIMEYPFIGI